MSVGHAREDLRQHVEAEGEGAASDGRGAEEGEGGGDGDHAAETDFAELVGGGGGQTAEDDVIVLLEVAGVGDDDAEADGEGEEDLRGGLEPDGGIGEAVGDVVRIPHVAEAIPDAELGLGRIGRTEGQHADQQDEGDGDQEWHAPVADELDALGEAAVDDDEVQDEHADEEQERRAESEDGPVGLEAGERGEGVGVGLRVFTEVESASEAAPGITQAPRLDDDVIEVDADRDDEAEEADVFAPRLPDDGVEDARRGIVALRAAEAAKRPFDPADRKAHNQERDEVGDQEGAAPGLLVGDEAGEAEEVTQSDGTAGDGHDDA